MHPVTIGRCVGWFHPALRPGAQVAVVICPALGREARWTYRSLVILADRLAEAGLATLRFDYAGTGDSADLQDGENPLTAWRDNVDEAVDWVRTRTGFADVALCGIRFGALLAADAAAQRTDVAALALLAPIVSGRAHVRELRLSALVGESGGAPGVEAQGATANGIELDGIVLSEDALAAIGRIDLARTALSHAAQVLLMDEGDRAEPYGRALESAGVQVTRLPFPGLAELLQVTSTSKVPMRALEIFVSWMNVAVARLPMGQPMPVAVEPAILHQPGCRERPVRFGADHRLAGILCEPDDAAPASGPAVLIANTGGDPRAGIARFGVRLARLLAAEGIASLRFDFAGLGDSYLAGGGEGHLYEVDRAADIAAALDLLEQRGYRRLGGVGLCAGAYHLLHAAIGDRRLERLALVNIVTFAWKKGDVLEVAQRALGRSTARYRELARERNTWRRLVRGRLDLRHLNATLWRRGLKWAARQAASAAGRLGIPTDVDRPRRMLRSLLNRGARVMMVVGFEDPALTLLEANFGRNARLLAALPGAEVHIERGFDHTLSRAAMHRRAAELIARHLR